MPENDSLRPLTARASAPAPRRRIRRWLRILLLTVYGLALVAALAAGFGVLWLRSAEKAALPVLDGDLHLPGLSAPVTVRRDAHGVPHIEAVNQSDLFFAQGYVTAQDRLWQMDAFRRNANGQLAEVLGPSLLKHDKAQRVLQIRLTARRIYAQLPAADRARLDQYANGVNLFIAQHWDSLPAEFRLLFYKPRPWRGEDSVSIGLTMVQTLDTHWDVKLSRERIAAKLNDPKLEADLYPVGSWRDRPPTGQVVDWSQPHPEPAAKDDPDDEEDERTQTRSGGIGEKHPSGAKARSNSDAAMYGLKPVPSDADEDTMELRAVLGLPSCDGCAAGSNNWVIAGKHTASGKPLLSNDMHLGLTEPNIWFMADLKAPGYHAAGVTLPGMPYVIAGHNDHVAWGFTALYADVQDLYVEKLDGKGNYEGNDATWHPLIVNHETIKVRGSKDVVLDVQSTAHGPLLNPILEKETRPMALRWTLYDPALNSLPVYEMNVAANWTEFSAALGKWCWPTQNVVYSDDQGHIAYQAVGRVPIPFLGNQVPMHHEYLELRQGTNEWANPGLVPGTYLPFDLMPHAFDPPSGFLATANSRVTPNNAPIRLTDEWSDPYRIERIYKSLEGRDQLKPADLLAVQTDVYSEVDQEFGHRFAYAIDHTPGVDDRLKKAADLMRSWDGRLTADSAAASLVTQARKALWPLILEPKLGKDAEDYRWSESSFAEEEIVMHAKADWLPKAYKNWDALLTEAVRKGMKEGKAPGDVSQWAYGSWHVVDIEHPLAKFLPLVGGVAGTGEQPLSGDTTTVKQVGRDFGPSQRFTMDWSNIDGSTENIVLGESGNPFSPYFRDQWNDYYGGTTFALPFSSAAVAAQTRHTLRLAP
jgi:penicillin amidase